MITIVVDEYDVDAVFNAMAEAGKINEPGRGFVYQCPVKRGLTNLASVFNPEKHSASIQQIIRAMDGLHGSTDWRANQLLIHNARGNSLKKEVDALFTTQLSLTASATEKMCRA